MPRRCDRKPEGKKRVYFRIKAPDAETVHLAGCFNGWDDSARLLKQDSRGTWRTSMMLPPGVYEYRYLVDGAWANESDTPVVPNPFGSQNCVRVV